MRKGHLGKKFSEEHRINIGKANKGKCKGRIPWNKGKNYWVGREHPKGMLGKHHSEAHNKIISDKMKGKAVPWLTGKHLSKEHKEKLRLLAFEYAKKVCGIICPRMGHNEKKILDKLEIELKYKILRQYKCEGYFIDGYIPELNLAIEIDEIPKNREKDIERQRIIEQKLNCKFMRINDFD